MKRKSSQTRKKVIR